jgi:hypothetical protein
MAEKKTAEKPAEQPKADEPKVDNSALEELAGKTIDERMAMLLKDHKAMGAR